MEQWSGEWLTSAGLSEIGLEYSDENGIIKSFVVNQELHGNCSINRLKTQKFNIALLDNDMKVIEVVVAKTSSEEKQTTVETMIGKPMPHAFIINYGDWGYAKFLIDERSQVALEQDINKVEDPNERKFLYNILFDAVKSKK